MTQRLWEGQPFEQDEVEILMVKIRKQIKHGRFEEAAITCEQLAKWLRLNKPLPK